MIGIYARQSIDKKDSISIDTQIDFCRRQLPEANEDVKVYVDRGYSGGNVNRPDFERMMHDVKNGMITKVIVYKLDRISRSLLDFAVIIGVFKEKNIDFISTQEKFDTSTPMGNAMLSIIMVFAQLERETIQLRIKDNFYARGKLGMYLGGQAPYGFRKVEMQLNGKKAKALEEDEKTIDILKQIFTAYANTGKSLGKIAKELNLEKIPSPNGTAWDSCKLSRIMRNPVYVMANADIYIYYKNKGCAMNNDISEYVGVNGCFLYGKRASNERKFTNMEGHEVSLALHKGVIDADTFLKCQYKMDHNRQIKNTGATKWSWLTGLTKCPYCGFAMTVICSHKEKYNFTCSGRKNGKLCSRKKLSFHVRDIEAYVEEILLGKMKKLKKVMIEERAEREANHNEHNIRLFKIEEQIQNLVEQVAQGSQIVAGYLNERIAELDKKKHEVLRKMQEQKSQGFTRSKMLDFLKMPQEWQGMEREQKKEIAKLFIDKINMYDERVEIAFNQNFAN